MGFKKKFLLIAWGLWWPLFSVANCLTVKAIAGHPIICHPFLNVVECRTSKIDNLILGTILTSSKNDSPAADKYPWFVTKYPCPIQHGHKQRCISFINFSASHKVLLLFQRVGNTSYHFLGISSQNFLTSGFSRSFAHLFRPWIFSVTGDVSSYLHGSCWEAA